MTERGMIFTAESVRAILAGRKTQTRRIAHKCNMHDGMKTAPVKWAEVVHPARESGWVAWYPGGAPDLAEFTKQQYAKGFECPYGAVGGHIWVRETYRECDMSGDKPIVCCEPWEFSFEYAADRPVDVPGFKYSRWKSSIFMPRKASRITLQVTGVRLERLQEITEADAIAEGLTTETPADFPCPRCKGQGVYPGFGESYGVTEFDCEVCDTSRKRFAISWDTINGKRGFDWESNPWVWVREFRRIG